MSSGSAFLPIQQAIYNILTTDTTLMSKIMGVFDFVIDNQAYPYVTIGETTSIPYETFDHFGEEATVTLHVWSRSKDDSDTNKGFMEIVGILDDLNRLLARQEYDVAGCINIASFYDFGETIVEPDGLTRHAVVRYRLLILKQD